MTRQQDSSIIISNNTQELLTRRQDDFRVRFANYILFDDEIRDDIKKGNNGYLLRKARPGDIFMYNLIGDYTTIKYNIEQNLSNLAKLKANKQLNNLKRIWLFCFDIDEKNTEEHPSIMIYSNPDAQDINKIFKDDRTILGVFIVVEYADEKSFNEIKNFHDITITNADSKIIEWVMLSPGDSNNIAEYNNFLKEKESSELGNIFYLNFNNIENT
jgi:hypothetical protein